MKTQRRTAERELMNLLPPKSDDVVAFASAEKSGHRSIHLVKTAS